MANGVCVFDLDGTVLPGILAGKRRRAEGRLAVQLIADACARHGFGMGINTARRRVSARTEKKLSDVGIYLRDMHPDAVQTGATTAYRKTKAMKKIREAYGIRDNRRAILFDDISQNIRKVRGAGYAGMHIRGGIVSPADASLTLRYLERMK